MIIIKYAKEFKSVCLTSIQRACGVFEKMREQARCLMFVCLIATPYRNIFLLFLKISFFFVLEQKYSNIMVTIYG